MVRLVSLLTTCTEPRRLQRKKTLLPQLLDRDRSGGVVDRRFGEGDASLTPEEKAIQRFALERQRRAGKAALFNLGDNEENGLGLLGEGDVDGGGDTLTHFGQNLANVRGALPDQEDFFQKSGKMGSAARGALASEGGEEQMGRDAADGMPQRKKSRAEVMEEVIAKSKAYKVGLFHSVLSSKTSIADCVEFMHCSTSVNVSGQKMTRSGLHSTMTWLASALCSARPTSAREQASRRQPPHRAGAMKPSPSRQLRMLPRHPMHTTATTAK